MKTILILFTLFIIMVSTLAYACINAPVPIIKIMPIQVIELQNEIDVNLLGGVEILRPKEDIDNVINSLNQTERCI